MMLISSKVSRLVAAVPVARVYGVVGATWFRTTRPVHLHARPKSSPRPLPSTSSVYAYGSAPPPQAVPHVSAWHLSFVKREVEAILQRYARTIIVLGLVLVFTGATLLRNRWSRVKEHLGLMGADVASRTVGDPHVQEQVGDAAQDLLDRILDDPATQEATITFLQKVVAQEATREALARLLLGVLTDSRVVGTLSHLVEQLLATPTIEASLRQLAVNVLQGQEVTDRTTTVLEDAAIRAFESPAVMDQARAFVVEAVKEETLQHEVGEAAWGAMKSAFRPKFMERWRMDKGEL